MTDYPDYPHPLKDIAIGQRFEMLNYDSMFMRVEANIHSSIQTIVGGRGANPLPFNDDGYHVPVVNLETGDLFWMAKTKSCRSWY